MPKLRIVAMLGILLAAQVIGSLAHAQGTPKPKAALFSEMASCFPDQFTGAVTPATMRACIDDVIASAQQYPGVNVQVGTSYAIQASDYGQLVIFNNANPVAVTIPAASGSFSPFSVSLQNIGAGAVTVTPASGTISGAATLALNLNQGTSLFADGTNWRTFPTVTAGSSVTSIGGLSGALLLGSGLGTSGGNTIILSPVGAATLFGNPGLGSVTPAGFTIQGLAARGAPDANNDKIPLFDFAAGTIKYVTPGQIASAATSGVSSIGGLTGAVLLGPTFATSGSTINTSGVLNGIRNAQSGIYTALGSDCGKTIALTGANTAFTMTAASNYTASDPRCTIFVINENASNGQKLSVSGLANLQPILYPGQTKKFQVQNNVWTVDRMFERYAVPGGFATIYASPSDAPFVPVGNNTNDCLTNQTACLTIVEAVRRCRQEMDAACLVQLLPGNFTEFVNIHDPTYGTLNIQGSIGTPAAVVVHCGNSGGGVFCFYPKDGAIVILQYLTMDVAAGGVAVTVGNNAVGDVLNSRCVTHNAAALPNCIYGERGAITGIDGSFGLAGPGGNNIFAVKRGAQFGFNNAVWTIENGMTWNNIVVAQFQAQVDDVGMTIVGAGAMTATKYICQTGSTFDFPADPNTIIPGSTGGTPSATCIINGP